MYQDYAEGLCGVTQRLEELLAEEGNPFIAQLDALLRMHRELYVAVPNPRMNGPVGAFFGGHQFLATARLIGAAQLRGDQFCEALVLFGPCGWYPEYVFTAPRARNIHVVSYSWIRDGWKPGPLFLHSTKARSEQTGHRVGRHPVFRQPNAAPPPTDPLDASQLLPRVTSGTAALRSFPSGGADNEHEEVVAACLCLLSGERTVFLEAGETS
ncbi:MAG: hypothetical protein L0099_17295, partial [Acidobacteria bacterium]|nr:hypothetical protein [Acidobacteriota bacterium]